MDNKETFGATPATPSEQSTPISSDTPGGQSTPISPLTQGEQNTPIPPNTEGEQNAQIVSETQSEQSASETPETPQGEQNASETPETQGTQGEQAKQAPPLTKEEQEAQKRHDEQKEKAIKELTALAKGYDVLLAERRRKKRWKIAIGAIVVLSITTLVFLALFITNMHNKEQVCGKRYLESVERTGKLIDRCIEDSFDYDTRYREITAELGCARAMIFEADSTQEQQTAISDLYTMAIKLPEQFKFYMSDIGMALDAILAGDNDRGYAAIDEIISKSDKLDYGVKMPDDTKNAETTA